MTQEAKQKIEKFFIIAFILLMALDFGGKCFKTQGYSKSPQDIPTKQSPSFEDQNVEPTDEVKDTYKEKQQERSFENLDEPQTHHHRKHKEQKKQNYENIVTITYCTSWSYAKAFEQAKQYIEESYPQLIVVGGNHPPTGAKQILSKIINFTQWGLIILLFAGDYIFAYFKISPPEIYLQMKQNKIISFIAIFFICSSITGMLQQTGAFEVMYGDKMIFSKLQTGRMPNIEELLRGIKRAMKH